MEFLQQSVSNPLLLNMRAMVGRGMEMVNTSLDALEQKQDESDFFTEKEAVDAKLWHEHKKLRVFCTTLKGHDYTPICGAVGQTEEGVTMVATAGFDHSIKVWTLDGALLATLGGNPAADEDEEEEEFDDEEEEEEEEVNEAKGEDGEHDGDEPEGVNENEDAVNPGEEGEVRGEDEVAEADPQHVPKSLVPPVQIPPPSKAPIPEPPVSEAPIAEIPIAKEYLGHTNTVTSVVFIDSHTLASASDDGTVKIWELSTQHVLRTFTGHNKNSSLMLTLVRWHGDDVIVSGGTHGIIKAWDPETLEVKTQMKVDALSSFHFTPGNFSQPAPLIVLSIGEDNEVVEVRNFETQEVLRRFVGRDGIIAAVPVCNFPETDTELRVVITYSKQLKSTMVWDFSSEHVIYSLPNVGDVNLAVLDTAKPLLVTSSEEAGVQIWDLEFGTLIRSLNACDTLATGTHPYPFIVTNPSFVSSEAQIWDMSSGPVEMVGASADQAIAEMYVCSVLMDGATVQFGLSLMEDDAPQVWDLSKGKLLRELAHDHNAPLPTKSGPGADTYKYTAFGVSSQSATPVCVMATSNVTMKTVKGKERKFVTTKLMVWNVLTGRLICNVPGKHERNILAIDVSETENGQPLVATGSADKSLKIWKLVNSTLELVTTLSGHTDEVTCVAFAPNSEAVVSGSRDKTMKIWLKEEDKEEYTVKCTLTEPKPWFSLEIIVSEARELIVGTFKDSTSIKVWDLISGAEENQQLSFNNTTAVTTAKTSSRDTQIYAAAIGGQEPVVVACRGEFAQVICVQTGATLRQFRIQKNAEILEEPESVKITQAKIINGAQTLLMLSVMYTGEDDDDNRVDKVELQLFDMSNLCRGLPSLGTLLDTVKGAVLEPQGLDAQRLKEFIKAEPKCLLSFRSCYNTDVFVEVLLDKSYSATAKRVFLEEYLPSCTECALTTLSHDNLKWTLLGYVLFLVDPDEQSHIASPVINAWKELLTDPNQSLMKLKLRMGYLNLYGCLRFNGTLDPAAERNEKKADDISELMLNLVCGLKILKPSEIMYKPTSDDLTFEAHDVSNRKAPFVVPVAESCAVEVLNLLLNSAEKDSEDVDLILAELPETLTQWGWRTVSKKYYLLLLRYIVYLAFFTLTNAYFNSWTASKEEPAFAFAWIMQASLFLFTFLYLWAEAEQAKDAGIKSYLCDPWNWFDLSSYMLVVAGGFVRISSAGENAQSRQLLAVATVLLWFKLLYFCRAHQKMGPVVSMIFAISYDVIYFLAVVLVVFFGFAQSFFLLHQGYSPDGFGTSLDSAYHTFTYMMGGFDPDMVINSASPWLSAVFLVVFLLITNILLLNMLIAKMGESFSRIQEHFRAQWRLEQAKVIVELNDPADVKHDAIIRVFQSDKDVVTVYSM